MGLLNVDHCSWQLKFDTATHAPDQVVLEGIHALKHALRFGAEVQCAVTDDKTKLLDLASQLAPDLHDTIAGLVNVVPAHVFSTLAARPPRSPVLAIASRPAWTIQDLTNGVSVVLYEPRHAGNAGAVIRVAAAAGAEAVVFLGKLDPWSNAVVRSAAGLHFAIKIVQQTWPLAIERPVVAFDPDEGDPNFDSYPGDAALLFGGERAGLPQEVLHACDRVLRIPMTAGVSSLNLATSVAVALYARRPAGP